jgi:ATP-binding cassette subfamily B protein
MLYRPIRQLADRFNVLQMGIVNSDRVFKLLAKDEGMEDPESDSSYAFRGDIEFENVWFAYEGEQWVLQDVSFRIEAGQKIAFVGATGAGKSTIINLLSPLLRAPKRHHSNRWRRHLNHSTACFEEPSRCGLARCFPVLG